MNGNCLRARRAALLLALVAAVAAFGFDLILNTNNPPPNGTGLPIKWPAGTIRLRLMLGAGSQPLSDNSTYNGSAAAAAAIWNGVLGSVQFQTELVAAGSPGDSNDVNELAFAAKVYGRDFGENTLAVTTGYSVGNERVESDITFNSAYTWDSYRGNTRRINGNLVAEIQRVTLHELGHLLGLDHPDEAGQTVDAIMNSTIDNRYELSVDDIRGAQAMYGPPNVPANDMFANATALSFSGGRSITVTGYNTKATKENNEPSHANDGGGGNANPGGRSVWWRWIAPSNGSVTIDTRGSYFDSLLGVYTGNALGSLTRVASNDDINPGIVQASTVTFNTAGGTTYHIAVDGFNGNDGFGADSAGLTLNLTFDGDLGTAPAITTHPAGVTVTRGASASFSVAATGTAPLSYQWLRNGSPITGATNSTYTIASTTSGDAGSYSVTVSNSSGSVTSNTATLTVNAPASPPPSSGGSGGGGGGGAPSLGFLAALAVLAATRALRRLSRSHPS